MIPIVSTFDETLICYAGFFRIVKINCWISAKVKSEVHGFINLLYKLLSKSIRDLAKFHASVKTVIKPTIQPANFAHICLTKLGV